MKTFDGNRRVDKIVTVVCAKCESNGSRIPMAFCVIDFPKSEMRDEMIINQVAPHSFIYEVLLTKEVRENDEMFTKALYKILSAGVEHSQKIGSGISTCEVTSELMKKFGIKLIVDNNN